MSEETDFHMLRKRIINEFHKLCNSATIYSDMVSRILIDELKEEEKIWYWFSLSLQAIREELKRQLDVPALPYATKDKTKEPTK